MKRSGPPKRKTALTRSEPLRSTTRLRPKSPTNSGRGSTRNAERVPLSSVLVVRRRSGGRCELAPAELPGCAGIAEQIHHRYPREYGGSHEPANLLDLCRSCHLDHVERYRRWADRFDLRIRRHRDEPAEALTDSEIRQVTHPSDTV